MSRLLAAALALLALLAPAAGLARPVNTGHLEAELVAQEQGAVPGGTVFVALRQKIDKGWHTYWRNPGDSGEPTQITWTLPAGWQAGEFVWPTPSRLPIGPLLNYGYMGEVLLPLPLQVPASAKPGATVTLKAHARFLVCELTCVPEEAHLTIDVPVVAAAARADPAWGEKIAAVLAAAPKPAGLAAVYRVEGEALMLAVTGAPLAGADLSRAYFFPFAPTLIDHAKPQPIERGAEGLTLTLPGGYAVGAGEVPATVAGVLSLGDKAWEVSATAGAPPIGAAGKGILPPAPVEAHDPAAAAPGGTLGLPLALAFAFLGGLILNLMPCVFPVLSMKAAALAAHAHEAKSARAQGIAYLLGVLATFLVLAGALIALKAAGQAIGWGFQLQSPAMVAGLAVVMLLVALNLSGVFEAGTSLQGAGAGLAARDGLTGSFLTGVLAVIVAAPCTAPFMASAMGYALTQSPAVSLPVFAALGLGLASPFVALSFSPALLRRMPRPGPWMETLRHVLAFPMYAAVAWLVWVLAQQAGPASLAYALAAGVLAAFAAWLWGLAQRSGRPSLPRLLAVVAAVGALALVVLLAMEKPQATAAASASGARAEVPYEAWTPERVAALRAEGRPVFVNFTAAWCVTCQVNEKTSLNTRAVAEALKRNNAVYLKGDWTNRDGAIAAALAEHGRAGVPLYLVYGADGSAPVILPQLLSEGMVAEALDKAGKR